MIQRRRIQRAAQGFTLVELLVALAISAILLAGVYQFFITQQRGYSSQDELNRVQQNARMAETLMAKAVQLTGSFLPDPLNAATISMRDQSILAATDRYLVLQYDDPQNTADLHVVAADEVVAFVVSKTVPTAGTAGGTEAIDVAVHFDKDGDGTLTDPADAHAFQIALNLGSPPYTLYRVTPTIAGGIVAEAIASNVDNFVLRYYDRDGQPVILGATGVEALANTRLTATQRAGIRSVEMELVLRTANPDPNRAATAWTDFPAGSVVTRDAAGAIAAGFTGFTDGFRRRKFSTRITPRSLAIGTCGRLELGASDPAPNCPDNTTITATVIDQLGQLVNGASVIFTTTDGTLSAGSGTTGASGQAAVDLAYTGTAKPVMASAQTDVICTQDGATRTVTLHSSFVVNFQPGPWDNVTVTPPTTLAYDTCPGFTFDFTSEVYDQCGNLVPPDPGLVFTAALPGGTSAPIATTDQLTDPTQTFTVSQPTAAGPWGAILADFVLTVAATGTVPAGAATGGTPVNPATFDVSLKPWPPSTLVWDSALPASGYEDCPSGPQTGSFHGVDCFANPVFDTFSTAASVDPKAGAPAPQGAGDQGTLFSAPSVPQASAAETVTIAAQSSGNRYDVSYLPPSCTLNPVATPTGIAPTVTVSYPATPAAPTTQLVQPLDLGACRDSCAITASVQPAGIASNPLNLTQCDLPAHVALAVTRCNLDSKEVRLTLNVSSGSATVHFADTSTGAALSNPTNVTFTPDPSVPNGYLALVDLVFDAASDGANVEVTAAYQDPSGNTYWTCDTLDVTVANLCTQLDIYTDPGYSQALTQGSSDCLAGIGELYFEVEDCQFTANRLYANVPDKGLWAITYVNGTEWDKEPVDLDPSSYGAGGNAIRLRSVNFLPFYRDDVAAVHQDGSLTYPPWGTIQVEAKYIDPNDATDSTLVCDQTTTLTAPLPICFPNAITSGGGAGWNGNFKAHWGDVVIRGNVALPAAAKRVEKIPTGQFDGSPFSGANNDDRFVDVYVGKSSPGDTTTGNFTGEPNPDPSTPDQPFLGTNHGNYFRNISYAKITDMISVIDYDTMKSLAEDRGVYWYTLPSGNVRNPDTGQEADLETVLTLPGPGLENAYFDGDYIFIDTYGTATTPPNTTGFDIDSTATADLPTFSFNGSLFTEGIVYVAGNVEFGGLGSTTNVTATTPPEQELHYDHNTTGWFTSEDQLPIRSDPTLPQHTFTVGVHINGAFYTDGEVSGSGNPAIYGAMTAERGYQGSGTPEIWYNYNLNVSGENSGLCVNCCTLQVSPSFSSLVIGDTTTLNGVDAGGAVEWTIAGNWPDTAGQTVATIGNTTGVLNALHSGSVQIRARDINNCVAYSWVWVTTPCNVFTNASNVDPQWAQLDVGDGQRFTVGYTPSGAGSVVWSIPSWSAHSIQIIGSGVAAGQDYADVLATCGGTSTILEATDPSCTGSLQVWTQVACPRTCNLSLAATPGTVPTGGSFTFTANTDVCEVQWELSEGGSVVGSLWSFGGTITGSYAALTVDSATPLQATVQGLADTPAGTQVQVRALSGCDNTCTDTATFDVASCAAITVTQNTAGSPLQVGSPYAFTAAGGSEDYTWRVGGGSTGNGSFSVSPSPDTEFADFTPSAGGAITVEVEDASGCTGSAAVEACGLRLDTAAAAVQVGGATATVNAGGALGTVNWTWVTPDGADLSLSTASGSATTLAGLVTGTATLTATDGGVTGCSADVAVTVSPAPGAWLQLTYDDFESGMGHYTDGGNRVAHYYNTTPPIFAPQGAGAVEISDDVGSRSTFTLTTPIDVATPGYTEIMVEFQYRTDAMESPDEFWLEYYDGSSWQKVGTWAFTNNGTVYAESVTIPESSYTFPSNMQIRFQCYADSSADYVYIDEVRISAR